MILSTHGTSSFASTIMRISYGMEISDEHDEYAVAVEDGVAIFNRAFVSGAFLIETFLFLQYVLPGAGFKHLAASWKLLEAHSTCASIADGLLLHDQQEGQYEPSVATTMMEKTASKRGADLEEERRLARDTAAITYAMQTFFMAMVCYPEVQRRARMELDAVVGPNRLPTFEDRDSLPYITAIAKESMRWQLVAPLGVPHVSLKDDDYNCYFIPAGSAVIANLWAFCHDPRVYSDPDTFNPDRFMKDGKINPDVRDPNTIVFGYGRKICPGRHFAEASLFIIIASVPHTLTIDYDVHEQGHPIILEAKMTYGVIS
ncbi:cytochrome P450 [Daedaleopsis nitida]|nr:cytochrome P450 [Daedaleopsis nitida]